jgi:cytochrome c553
MPRFSAVIQFLVLCTVVARAPIALSGAEITTPGGEDAAASAPEPETAKACYACHGPEGASQNPAYPILAGQTSRYIYLQLKDFKEGRRSDPQMSPMAANLSKEDMLALAAFFGERKFPPNGFKADAAKAAAGKQRADDTLCTMCHQGSYQGQNEIPRLAGQHFEYIKKQLTAFKAKTRTNDAGNMTAVANTLSDEDIENIAHYLSGI